MSFSVKLCAIVKTLIYVFILPFMKFGRSIVKFISKIEFENIFSVFSTCKMFFGSLITVIAVFYIPYSTPILLKIRKFKDDTFDNFYAALIETLVAETIGIVLILLLMYENYIDSTINSKIPGYLLVAIMYPILKFSGAIVTFSCEEIYKYMRSVYKTKLVECSNKE